MNFDDIEYLLVVAEQRHIGRAAEALGLTQPALSRAIARLEALAGQRLFTRHPRGVEPTPAGQTLLKRALRIRREYDDAMRELQQMKTGQLGLLRVGYSPSVEGALVLGALGRLLAERPAARLRLLERLTQELLEQLADDRLDLVIAPAPVPLSDELSAEPLYTDRLLVVADRGHPLLRATRVTLADIAAEPWLLPTPKMRVRRALDELVAGAGLAALNARIESDTITAGHFRLLEGTRMLALCTEWWLPTLRRLGLEPLPMPPDEIGPARAVALMRRLDGYVSPLAARLRELLTERVGRRAD